MWLSLIITLLTYLLSPRDTSSERRKALIRAAAVGGGTYLATQNTDWGRDISKSFDDMIGVSPTDKPIGDTGEGTAANLVDASKAPAVTKPGTTGGAGGGFWSTLTSWGAAGTAAVIGTAGVATGTVPKWLIIAGLGLVGLLILK